MKRCILMMVVLALCLARPVRAAVHHSSDFRWTAEQDITDQFAKLLESGALKAGEELVLDHTFRIGGAHKLPDNFTLSAAKGAGFDVTDADRWEKHRKGGPFLELGESNTLRNLTITYLNTPPLGPTGEKHGKNFARLIGIYASGKGNLLWRSLFDLFEKAGTASVIRPRPGNT